MKKELSESTREIIRYALIEAANEMKIKLIKMSVDTLFYEAKDFSVGLFNSKGEMLSQAAGLPHFLGNLGQSIKETAKDIGGFDKFKPGDVYITNDPYSATLHINDMTVIYPIFWDDELIAFSVARGHWSGIGAAEGVQVVSADNMFKEGNVFKSIKLWDRGKLNYEVMKIITYNCRIPDKIERDLYAQKAACYVGEQRLKSLVKKYGKERFFDYTDAILDHAERFARNNVKKIPDGEYEASGYWDDDGVNLNVPIPIHVKVIVNGDEVTIDLTGSSKRVPGSANCGRTQSETECRWAYCAIVAPFLPTNEGIFRPLHVIIPEGSIFNAKKPDATYLGYGPADVAKDLIYTALAPAIPRKVCAPNYGQMENGAFYGIWSKAQEFWYGWVMMAGGTGGNFYKDGQNAMTFGDLSNEPQEKIERNYPFKVIRYTLPSDSEGAGKHRGGFGLLCEVEFTGKRWSGDDVCKEAKVCSYAGRGKNAPTWGILGGHSPRLPNYIKVNPGTPEEVDAFRKSGYPLKIGDVVQFYACGGGGYGDPLERDAKLVQEDAREGLISVKRAKEIYGVVLDPDTYKIDVEETKEFRQRLLASRNKG